MPILNPTDGAEECYKLWQEKRSVALALEIQERMKTPPWSRKRDDLAACMPHFIMSHERSTEREERKQRQIKYMEDKIKHMQDQLEHYKLTGCISLLDY